MARRKVLVTYLIAWLIAIGTALRYLSRSRSYPESVPPDVLRALAVLFAAFFVLLFIEPWLTRRSTHYAHMYLLAQSVIVIVVSLMTPGVAWTGPSVWNFQTSSPVLASSAYRCSS